MRVKDDIDISDFLKMEYRTIAVRRFNKYLVDFFSKQCGVDNQHGKWIKTTNYWCLDLEDLTIEDISSTDPLFNDGLD